MSKKIKCEQCNGWGELKDKIECPKCNGIGLIKKKDESSNRSIKQTCPICSGTGKIRPRCRSCKGYGWYKLKEEKVRIGNKRWY